MSITRLFLAITWLLPCIALLGRAILPGEFSEYIPLATGVDHSSRLLLLSSAALAYLFAPKTADKSGVAKWGWLFLIWVTVCCLASGAPFDTLLFAQIWFACALFFAALRTEARTLDDPRTRQLFVHLPVILITSTLLLEYAVNVESSRQGGVFELPGVLSNWLVFLLPLLLYDALVQPRRQAAVAALASVLSLTAIVIVLSRAGWILGGIEISLILFCIARLEPRRFLMVIGSLLLGLAILVALRGSMSVTMWAVSALVVLAFPPLYWRGAGCSRQTVMRLIGLLVLSCVLALGASQMTSTSRSSRALDRLEKLRTEDNSSRARIKLWKSGVSMTMAHPILGVGPGNFSTHYPRHQDHFYYYSDSPHSAVLELSSETGLVGLILFVGVFLGLLYRVSRSPLEPSQRAACLGLMCGLVYTQIEVTYQFGYLWLTMAALAVFLLPRTEVTASSSPRPISVALALLVVLVFGYLYLPIRQVELAAHEPRAIRAVSLMERAAHRLPFWRRAALLNFQKRMEININDPTLTEDLQKLITIGDDLAAAHAQAGDYLLYTDRPEEAITQYQRALELDPYNLPSAYQGLIHAALSLEDTELVEEVIAHVRELYVLDELTLAHPAHREKLLTMLSPMLFDIADRLSPYYHPEETETLYRFLLSLSKSPRALYGLGISLWTQEQFEEALPYLEEAHRIDPRFPEAPELPGQL